MHGVQGDLILEPAMLLASGDHQLGECLGAHLNAVDLDCSELLLRDLVDSVINRDQLGVSPIDGAPKTFDLLLCQFGIDLGDAMLNGLNRSLELSNTIRVTREQPVVHGSSSTAIGEYQILRLAAPRIAAPAGRILRLHAMFAVEA